MCDMLPAIGGSPQIRTYCHGILYSVFGRRLLREAAMQRGTPELLEAVAATSEEVFAQQIKHILRRLTEPEADPDTDVGREAAAAAEGGPEAAAAAAAGYESADEAGDDGDLYYEDEEAFADVEGEQESTAHEQGERAQGPASCTHVPYPLVPCPRHNLQVCRACTIHGMLSLET